MSNMNQSNEPVKPVKQGDVDTNKDSRMWGMILHLSMLANFAMPPLGWVAPIVIWQIKKDELPVVDVHGKNAVNWIISAAIYGLIGAILTMVIVGFFVLLALGICTIVFPIIAGVKANNGEVWKYPLTIEFFK